jgi:NAD(P)-dependent dehydrogenase (short-subunit alcohol dehydrogenase family)
MPKAPRTDPGPTSSSDESALSSAAVAVVTGATSGIGRAVAVALAKPGWSLVLLGRNRERLEDTAAEVIRRGAEPDRVAVDLGSTEELERCAARLRETLPRLDVLVHAAGRFARGSLESLSPAEFDALYATNVRAPWRLTRELLPLLRASRGQVVFVNSSAVFTHPSHCGAYSATKAALLALADTLRREVNEAGVRVLSVFPGRTATPMQEDIHRAEATPYRPERLLQADDVAAAVIGALAMPRTAEVTDIRIRPNLKS